MPSHLDQQLNENVFPGNTAAFESLKIFMERGSVVGLTGAGVSVPICPTWTALLNNLLNDAVRSGLITEQRLVGDYKELIRTDPLELAGFLEEAFLKKPFRSRLAEIFRNPTGAVTECHDLITDLKLKGIVTLNYDNGHECAFSKKGIHVNVGRPQDATLSRWIEGKIFEDSTPPILHLHGDVSDPDNMVITSDDYDRFYSSLLPESAIQHLWRANRLLVIGFGFTDPFLIRVAEKALRNLETDNLHFALIGKRASEPVTWLQRKLFTKKYRLSPIFYEIIDAKNPDNATIEDHSNLASILSLLPKPNLAATINVVIDAKNPVAIIQSPPPQTSQPSGEAEIRRDFEKDLFVLPNRTLLYVEPRLAIDAGVDPSTEKAAPEIAVKDIVSSTDSFIITARPEYGATTLAKKLVVEITAAGKQAILRDSASLPTYKKKLEEYFSDIGAHQNSGAVIILDGIDFTSDERLIKEIIGTKIFSRIIIFARLNSFNVGNAIPIDQFSIPFKVVSLSNFHRADIRTFASKFFETSDEDLLSGTVEQVYKDLIALCIPLTPANIVMYLTILHKEGDFHPINRVQIVSRYLDEMLLKPSDAFSDKFNARDKMNVISDLVYKLYEVRKSSFNEADWFVFCRDYMKNKICYFDERRLLADLLATRVLVRIGSQISFKYGFFYIFFLGRYLSKHPDLLAKFISGGPYLQHEGLTEVIAELAPNNAPLFIDIVARLNQSLDEFNRLYVPESFDPFAKLEWPSDAKEEENLWQPLAKAVAEGPRNSSELDEIKRSIAGEKRANNQNVVVQNYDRLEQRLIRLQSGLVEALRNSDALDGELKKSAVLCALKAYFRYYQVGLIFAPIIAEKSFFFWHGMLFVIKNFSALDDVQDKEKRVAAVMSAFRRGVADKAAEEIGSKKLGEVFKLFAKDPNVAGCMALINFTCLVRGKPHDWFHAAQNAVANTDRKAYFLRSMLSVAFKQFSEEVNTGGEREELKKLIATIRLKRYHKKDFPGERDLAKAVNRLEELDYFEKASAQIEPRGPVDTENSP